MRGMNIGTHAALGAVLTCATLGTLLSGCGIFLNPAPPPPGPPRTLSPEELIGTWRDEAHGRLTFATDGSFTATDVCGDYLTSGDDDIVRDAESPAMTGTGTWDISTWTHAGDPGPVTTIRIELTKWFADYEAGGTADSPKLWVYMSLDNAEYCILSKRP
ncbi:hypothetical protein ACNPQM_21610 [Streptomyces sp. NPDC056231]|uniref:hypothetical protein n=1 Tax=Streptomyces sp. NPDC056231 TaxID=3345755 RepID=UPI003AAE37ED